ncbi:ADP/ATP translocase [Trypanosoma grayi]|uniref:ADP/ATP translocase n=1 Tax=Trypanosoma grayi TaxID=71804 RepID=UPI0004F46A27|nr:ADP/ATP translocase [Trypanosoma grayi]KEG10042.1 ADP/ATP translocase [Trypanosoma grayi]
MPDEHEARVHSRSYQPDDPEFYLDEHNQLNPGAELAVMLRRISGSIARVVIVNWLRAPFSRVFLLQCAQGELVKNGRLPLGGFGGIRGCVYYIITKEGVLGLFRGCLEDMVLAVPAYIAEILVALGIAKLQQQLAPLSWSAAVMLGVAAPGLRVVFTAPVVGYKNTVLCNYVADIVAPNGNKTLAKEDVEEAYLYSSSSEAATAVKKQYGWKGLFFTGVDIDVAAVYAQSITTQIVGLLIMPKLEHFIRVQCSQPGWRLAAMLASTLGVRLMCGIVFQPFQVMRARTALLPTATELRQRKRCWFWRSAQNIVRQDGITALWAGLRMRLLRDVCGALLDTMFVGLRRRSS